MIPAICLIEILLSLTHFHPVPCKKGGEKQQIFDNIGGFQAYMALFCFLPLFGGKVVESVH